MEPERIKQHIDDKDHVAIYLVNGIKLTGHILQQDDTALILSSTQAGQMVYKHAIATLVPLTKGPKG